LIQRERKMAIEFTVKLEDRPGTLAALGELLGEADINIEAIRGAPIEGKIVVNFVADDPDKTATALKAANIQHTTREVLIVNILDQPGTLGDVARVMASAGINIDAVYVMTNGKVVLRVDDLDGAKQVAGGMAVM
jgi:hypothetical protein